MSRKYLVSNKQYTGIHDFIVLNIVIEVIGVYNKVK